MKKILQFVGLSLLLVMLAQQVSYAQPFINEIKAFKKQDSLHPAPQHAILFIGSSSFRKWTEVQEDFPGYTIINRGFGGSTIPDVIRYAGDIIFPYHPKQIVIYCGDNDIASADTVTAAVVLRRFKTLFGMIRSRLPHTSVVFVAIKPSPSRERLMPEMEKANQLVKQFLAKYRRTAFVDVYHPMLNAEGKPMGDIFEADRLHMNRKGYAIWTRILRPYLIK